MSDGRHPGRNILIAGFRLAGKTTVGREVARRLRRPFVDVPQECERRMRGLIYQLRFINREPSPYEVESRLVVDLSYRRETVIALGSDTFDNRDYYEELKIFSFIVLLDPPFPVLWERLEQTGLASQYKSQEDAGRSWRIWRAAFPRFDLALTSDRFSAQMNARLVTHCFFT